MGTVGLGRESRKGFPAPEVGLCSRVGAGRYQGGQDGCQAAAGLGAPGRMCVLLWGPGEPDGALKQQEKKEKIDQMSTINSLYHLYRCDSHSGGRNSEHLRAQGLSFSICKMGLSEDTSGTQ